MKLFTSSFVRPFHPYPCLPDFDDFLLDTSQSIYMTAFFNSRSRIIIIQHQVEEKMFDKRMQIKGQIKLAGMKDAEYFHPEAYVKYMEMLEIFLNSPYFDTLWNDIIFPTISDALVQVILLCCKYMVDLVDDILIDKKDNII